MAFHPRKKEKPMDGGVAAIWLGLTAAPDLPAPGRVKKYV